jgi:hypothetical protein
MFRHLNIKFHDNVIKGKNIWPSYAAITFKTTNDSRSSAGKIFFLLPSEEEFHELVETSGFVSGRNISHPPTGNDNKLPMTSHSIHRSSQMRGFISYANGVRSNLNGMQVSVFSYKAIFIE